MNPATDQALVTLCKLAARHPEMRITQIIGQATGMHDPYHVSDAALAVELEAWEDRMQRARRGGQARPARPI